MEQVISFRFRLIYTRRMRILPRLLPGVLLLLIIVTACLHWRSGEVGARLWLLYAARSWLEGKALYGDLFEVNPPLILWLYAIPARLSLATGLDASRILVALGFALAALASAVSLRVLRAHPAFADAKESALLLGFAFLFVAVPNPDNFADRESLFVMLVFPYLLRFMPSLAEATYPRPLRWLVGLMAAVGFCIKPHCLLALAAVQAARLVQARSPGALARLETGIVVAGIGLYIALIFLLTPDYVRIVLPMALATYAAFSHRLESLLPLTAIAVTIAIAFADVRRDVSPFRRDIPYHLLLCTAMALYAVANNGWAYTYYPLTAMSLFTVGWVGLEFRFLSRRDGSQRRYVTGQRAACAALALYLAFFSLRDAVVLASDCGAACEGESVFALALKRHGSRSFGTITTNFLPWPPLALTPGIAWDTRFNQLWMLPKFFLSGPDFAARNAWVLNYVANAYAQDLDTRRPGVVFVNHGIALVPGRTLDLPGYLSAVPAFRKSWDAYRLAETIDACDKDDAYDAWLACRYDVFVRMDHP